MGSQCIGAAVWRVALIPVVVDTGHSVLEDTYSLWLNGFGWHRVGDGVEGAHGVRARMLIFGG